MKSIQGLGEIAGDYDLFLIDQWGVIHDGETPYDGAIDTLAELKALDRPVVILSNSARRTHVGIEKMDSMDIPREFYDHLVTSGEQTWQALRHRGDSFHAGLGRRCLLFSWGADRGLTGGGIDLDLVEDMAEADFILMAGTNREPLDYYEPILQAALARGIPMICANPDLVSVTPDGELVICPGQIARRYEEIGGFVRWHGKPHREIYEACFALYPDAKRILGIGDSLHHDIAGATAAGIDSLFIAAGVHAPALGIEWGEAPSPVRLEAVYTETGQRPNYMAPVFRW
jgi:HAD superfamily hydrolase (TIGR01459 family)